MSQENNLVLEEPLILQENLSELGMGKRWTYKKKQTPASLWSWLSLEIV